MKKHILGKALTLTVAATLLSTSVFAASNSFKDVKSDAYYFNPVMWALEQNITGGTSATTFSPDASCTRAQVVTFLHRAAGSPAPTTSENPFSDVKSDAYYYNAVLWAVENNITGGTSATTFSPDASCTRAQVVTFLHRSASSVEPAATANPFSDIADGAYYSKPVLWAVENNITGGTSATTFSPDASCTRAQVVTFLYRNSGSPEVTVTPEESVKEEVKEEVKEDVKEETKDEVKEEEKEKDEKKEFYTVSFNNNDGKIALRYTIQLRSGETATPPEKDPTLEGYTFDGWYTEAEGGVKFDFSAPVTQSYILYAHWIKK